MRPSLVDAKGSGSRRRYSYTDLLELRVIKSLLDAGIKLESVREVFTYLREQLGEDITTANLVIQGSSSVVIQTDGELIDLVKNGQGVLNILPLAGVRQEMDARIRELHPEPSEATVTRAGQQPVTPTLPLPGEGSVHLCSRASMPGLRAPGMRRGPPSPSASRGARVGGIRALGNERGSYFERGSSSSGSRRSARAHTTGQAGPDPRRRRRRDRP